MSSSVPSGLNAWAYQFAQGVSAGTGLPWQDIYAWETREGGINAFNQGLNNPLNIMTGYLFHGGSVGPWVPANGSYLQQFDSFQAGVQATIDNINAYFQVGWFGAGQTAQKMAASISDFAAAVVHSPLDAGHYGGDPDSITSIITRLFGGNGGGTGGG